MPVVDALSIAKYSYTVLLAGRFACWQLLSSHAWPHGGSSKPTVPGPPPATQHLYTNGALGHAVQFALPLTSSTPTATLSLPQPAMSPHWRWILPVMSR